MDDTSDSTAVTGQTTPTAEKASGDKEQQAETSEPKLGLPSPSKGHHGDHSDASGSDPGGGGGGPPNVDYSGWVPSYATMGHPYSQYGMEDYNGDGSPFNCDGELYGMDDGSPNDSGRGPQVSDVCQRLMKTRFCRYGEHCKYGAKCFYAHSQDELRQRPPPPPGFARQSRQDYIDPQAYDPGLLQFAGPPMIGAMSPGQYAPADMTFDINPYGCPLPPPPPPGPPITPPRQAPQMHPSGLRLPPGLSSAGGGYGMPMDSPAHQMSGDGSHRHVHGMPSPTNEMFASPLAVAERIFGNAGLKPEQIASILKAAQPVSYGD